MAPSGGFTLGSAMKLVRSTGEEEVNEDNNWKVIWKLAVPQRLRMFMWLSYQDRLMSNANRFIRHLTDDPRCYVCGEVEENTIHILRECPVAKILWRKLGVRV